MTKPPLGFIPRHLWLENRVSEVLAACSRLKECKDWNNYIRQAKIFSEELLYCSTEWEKYYQKERNEQ